jgi:hypothetical protein
MSKKARRQISGWWRIAVISVLAAGTAVTGGAAAAAAPLPPVAVHGAVAQGTVGAKASTAGRETVTYPRRPSAGTASGDLAPVLTAVGHGGYTSAGIGMRNLGYGTIDITGVPKDAAVESATLLWDVLDAAADPADADGTFGGKAITGASDGTGASPCWSEATANYSFEADVTDLVDGNGSYDLSGFASGDTNGQDPFEVGSDPPMMEGASLVVIYKDDSLPESTIMIAGGAAETDSGNSATATLGGFTVGEAPTVTTTYIVADGQEPGSTAAFNGTTLDDVSFPGAAPQAVPDYSEGNLWDNVTTDVTDEVAPGDTSASLAVTGNEDCLVWAGQVLDVAGASVLGLGDSVAAGYGIGDSQGEGDNPSAYPVVLATMLGGTANDLAFEGACAAYSTDPASNCNKVNKKTSVADQITAAEDASAKPGGFTPSVVTLTVGHDVCASDPEWVFPPVLKISLSLKVKDEKKPDSRTISFQISHGDACPAPVDEGGDTERFVALDGKVGSVNFDLILNCFPHPTATGQQGLAEDFYQKVPASE